MKTIKLNEEEIRILLNALQLYYEDIHNISEEKLKTLKDLYNKIFNLL